ncbi:MAG: serine/threonine protein kinase, partial [Leptospiraceae bacterium]|nr:serine/threonine protein kinase [Leptospiraceae bacterium]
MERYTELNKINETGNSIIYKAKDNSIGRDVVIKKIRNPNKEYKIRLEREIKILSKLEHPNIVPIYDTYEDLDGTLCYVMRYIEGKTLLDSIEDFDKNQRMRVFSQILNVLDFVHKNNIIHRDLKPGNILIDSNHNLYLIDFGIAKDLDADYTRITRTGQYIGSQSYSSPEQEKGEKLTQKSDLYSLGLIFYEMIYGKTFIRDNLDKKKKDPLLRIIFKMTEKKLEDRYSNCEEIQKDLMNLRGEGKLKKFFSFLGYFLIGIFI